MLIANEWENQDEVLKQHALPTVSFVLFTIPAGGMRIRLEVRDADDQTSLASRAIDGLSDPATREGVINALMEYLETDTI